MAMLGPYRESNRCSSSGYSLHMNTPDFYAGTAEQDISSAVTGAHDFAETMESAPSGRSLLLLRLLTGWPMRCPS
jgi:hypothetical protein